MFFPAGCVQLDWGCRKGQLGTGHELMLQLLFSLSKYLRQFVT